MKIVFVCPRFYPEIGGVERHVREVGKRLIEQGHTIDVVCETTAAREITWVFGMRVHYLSFATPGFFKKFRIWASMLTRIPFFLKADVIHIHDVFFWYFPLRFLLFWKPVYATFHGYEGVVPPRPKAVLIRRLSSFLATRTIEIGYFIQKWYGTKPNIVLYGGVSEEIEKVETTGDTETNAPRRFVLLGRLSQDIGIDLYMRFFSYLREKKVPYMLDIYGEGPYRKKLERYGTVHSFVKDTFPIIKKVDIVCASSYLTMIDACAAGKQVLAFYDNALKKDYLMEFPLRQYMVITDSVEEAFEGLFSKQHFSKAACVQEARAIFSWDTVVDRYLTLWKK